MSSQQETETKPLANIDPIFASLSIEVVSIDALKPFGSQARTHNDKQITQIAQSIEAFGFLRPFSLIPKDRVICGYGRLEALKRLQRTTVPAVRIEHLSEDEKRAYVIADNRLAELAGWD